jgi:hypothetical protein
MEDNCTSEAWVIVRCDNLHRVPRTTEFSQIFKIWVSVFVVLGVGAMQKHDLKTTSGSHSGLYIHTAQKTGPKISCDSPFNGEVLAFIVSNRVISNKI